MLLKGTVQIQTPQANHFAGVLLLVNLLGEAGWQSHKEMADLILHNSFPEGNAPSSKYTGHFKQVFCKYTLFPLPPCPSLFPSTAQLWTIKRLINRFGPLLHGGHLLRKLVMCSMLTIHLSPVIIQGILSQKAKAISAKLLRQRWFSEGQELHQ